LNAAEVKYLLVDGFAVAHHAQPRFTRDLDVWVEIRNKRAAELLQDLADVDALERFGPPVQAGGRPASRR